VAVLGAIGMLMLIGALFVAGWTQSVMVELGSALLLIPPLVVTERLVLEEDVRTITNEALDRVSSLTRHLEAEYQEINDLFSVDSDFRSDEALNLMKASSAAHHISRWGIAVPLVQDEYDLLLGLHFDFANEPARAHYARNYEIEAQDAMNFRILTDEDAGYVSTEGIWEPAGDQTTDSFLRRVRDELLDRGLHPATELDFVHLCERIRQVLLKRHFMRRPGSGYRSDVAGIITVIGDDLAVTVKGIEHLRDAQTNAIPLFATFARCGLSIIEEDDDKLLPDDYWFNRSGLANHSDLDKAMIAVRVLYRTGLLRGLADARLNRTGPE